MKNKKTIVIIFSLLLLFTPHKVYAVMPPDFLFNVASQFMQVFSVAIIALSAFFCTTYQFIKTKLSRKLFWIIATLSTLIIAAVSSYFYLNYRQNVEYQKWLAESERYSQIYETKSVSKKPSVMDDAVLDKDLDKLEFDGKLELDDEELETEEDLSNNRETNEVVTEQDVPVEDEKIEEDLPVIKVEDVFTNNSASFEFKIPAKLQDDNARFIKNYYGYIAHGNLEEAYQLSKQSADLNTFKSWYAETTKVTIDKLVRIDKEKSSLKLTLYEGNVYTRYGVLITLLIEDDVPIKVESSEVRTLGEGTLNKEPKRPVADSELTVDFYSQNEDTNLVISNEEFKTIINGARDNYVVLDAREDLEYKNGSFPGSLHIRFADLKAGRWIEVPDDKFVYVICWSGIRGQEVAEFLHDKKIVASYLENGAQGWVESGGKWNGSIKFSERYSEDRYRLVFSTEEIKNKISEGVILVDSRDPAKFQGWHIPGSVNIAMMYTPSVKLVEVFTQVPLGSKVITVCDDYVNCFDAKVTGVELEERGYEFLGRYNKPWEYE